MSNASTIPRNTGAEFVRFEGDQQIQLKTVAPTLQSGTCGSESAKVRTLKANNGKTLSWSMIE